MPDEMPACCLTPEFGNLCLSLLHPVLAKISYSHLQGVLQHAGGMSLADANQRDLGGLSPRGNSRSHNSCAYVLKPCAQTLDGVFNGSHFSRKRIKTKSQHCFRCPKSK